MRNAYHQEYKVQQMPLKVNRCRHNRKHFGIFVLIISDSWTGYSSLDCHSWLLRDCRSCFQVLLTFRVSIEKTDVNLLALPLCVSWVFFFAVFIIIYLFYISVFWLLCDSKHFFSVLVYLYFICLFLFNRHLFLYIGEIFFCDFAEYIFSVFDLGIFLLYP